jgi:hypothetical protein
MPVKPISSPIGNATQTAQPFLPPLLPLSPGLRMYLAMDIAFLVAAGVGIACVFARPWIADRLKQLRRIANFKPRPRISCNRCAYFGQNPYLKCAIHPTIVMTEQAADCRDYAAQNAVTERKLTPPKIFRN